MNTSNRAFGFIDRLIIQLDQGVRTIFGQPEQNRPHLQPGMDLAEPALSARERKHTAGLIRVDHTGEVCAQALYQGQALTARSSEVRARLQQSAEEENDHLVWCAERLKQLNSHKSYLNPLWYLGSFAMGAIAGWAGDKWSLGFVAETERQVVKHIDHHLESLPGQDTKSRAILEQMREDESYHASVALESGGAELPAPIKMTMRFMSKVMTGTAFYV